MRAARIYGGCGEILTYNTERQFATNHVIIRCVSYANTVFVGAAAAGDRDPVQR